MINAFEFIRAGDVPEALEALAREDRVVPVAGGTNVLVYMKRAPLEVDVVVSYDPPWTSDRMTAEGKAALRGFGVAA